MSVKYLDSARVTGLRKTDTPAYGLTVAGYTKRAGAPDCLMLQLDGAKRWRRLMYWCFSNASTHFVRVDSQPLIVAYPEDLFNRAARKARMAREVAS